MAASAVVLLSGGLDSATTLAIAQDQGFSCHCLSFDYGQRHRAELDAARSIADSSARVATHRVFALDLAQFGGSALTDSRINVPTDGLTAGIPVMGHLGLTPQSIYKFGTYTVRAKEEAEAEKLLADAKLLEEAGCFALVLEKIPAQLAKKVAESISIPVIGIGAGPDVDGQVLVLHDMLGMTHEFSPRFLRRYLNLYEEITGAVGRYVSDVKSRDFPNASETY